MKKRYRFRPLGIVTQNLKRHRLTRIRWHALVEVDPMEIQVLPWVTEVTLLGPFDPNPKIVLFSVPKNSPIDAVVVGVLIFQFCSVSARGFKATKDARFLYISTIFAPKDLLCWFLGQKSKITPMFHTEKRQISTPCTVFFRKLPGYFPQQWNRMSKLFRYGSMHKELHLHYKKSTYKEVGSKVIKIFIETIDDCSLMDLVEVNCCFCVIIDTIRQLVVVLLEIFKNLLSNNWVTAHENFFIFFSILVPHPVFTCISL